MYGEKRHNNNNNNGASGTKSGTCIISVFVCGSCGCGGCCGCYECSNFVCQLMQFDKRCLLNSGFLFQIHTHMPLAQFYVFFQRIPRKCSRNIWHCLSIVHTIHQLFFFLSLLFLTNHK